MKKICFAVTLSLSLTISHTLTAQNHAKPQPPKSIAVTEYSGDEERPVTLSGNFKLSREKVMKNVDDNTAVILIYNGTGRDLPYFQLDISGPVVGKWADLPYPTIQSYHGLGPLLKGEKRIIKAKDRAPFEVIRLVFTDVGNRTWGTGSARFLHRYFEAEKPYLFTLKEDGKGQYIKVDWEEWKG